MSPTVHRHKDDTLEIPIGLISELSRKLIILINSACVKCGLLKYFCEHV